jgi:NADH:ubiquinone oxidoreductase subunit 2 (subunit N)
MKERDGHTGALYDDKETWTKYSIFYDSYKRDYWWVFVPFIVYMAVKGIVIAAGDGAGKSQTIAILIVEAIMLGLLLWSRPFEEKSHNILNIVIQVVRVLSVVCVLVFVREFGISQDTKTVTGVALIAVQSTLTGVLALLLVAHVFMAMCETNKHRKRRKEAGKSIFFLIFFFCP